MSDASAPTGGILTEEQDADACGLRERKKRRTRGLLHRAALQLVAQEGLAGVTVERIAAEADVSPRTFFNYFPTKEAAVLGTTPESVDRIIDRLATRPADEPPLASLRAALRETLTPLLSDPELRATRRAVLQQNPSMTDALLGATAGLERRLRAAVAARMGRDADDPDAVLLAGAALVPVRAVLVGGGLSADEAHERFEHCFDVLAGGLGDLGR